MAEPQKLEWKPPGPGAWERETSHFGGQAATPLLVEVFPEPFRKGFATSCARYGLLLSHFELRFVNGIGYVQPAPVGAPPGATKLPPKIVFTVLQKVHPELRQRLKTCATTFERKPWREDLSHWDREAKPRVVLGPTGEFAGDCAVVMDVPLPPERFAQIDIVNLFRASEHVPGHVDEILRLDPLPKVVWMQLGIHHGPSAQRLRDAGIEVIQDRCIMVDHKRIFTAPAGA